ncbi:hypothetical protein BDW69DRAFT_84891 [Aspergillus filifer]
MTGRDGCQPSTLAERVELLVNDAFNLSLFHRCKVYVLVEHNHGAHTFKSVEQDFWPPPDHRLEELYPRIDRFRSHQLIRARMTEDERKALIQLSLFFLHLTDYWPVPGVQAHTDAKNNDLYWTSKMGENR